MPNPVNLIHPFAHAGCLRGKGSIEDDGIKGREVKFGLVVMARFICFFGFPGSHLEIAGGVPGEKAGARAAESVCGVGHTRETVAVDGAFDADGFIINGRKAAREFVAFFREGIEDAACF